MLKMFKFILCLVFVFVECECAKILGVFPTPSISHQVVFRPLMLELVKRGHEVTVITTDRAFPKGQGPQNLTEIDLHDISYEHWNTFIAEKGNEKNPLVVLENIYDLLSDLVEKQLKTKEIKNFLRNNEKFDLLFVESYIRPALIFSHLCKAPVIEFSSLSGILSAFDVIGAATHPVIYPNPLHRRIYNLTLWEKITKLYIHYASEYIFAKHEHVENEMLKGIFGSDIPKLGDIRRNVQMLFLNVHPIWDFNRPVPTNVVYLGGLHQKPQHELPKVNNIIVNLKKTQNIQSYLDSSKNGVIYISFGTNVKPSMLPPDKLKIFTDVFSKLPYDVLWKWDKDELPGRPQNVKILKWLPQSDMLRHPKVKLFITQGGLQSTDEALTAGVPLIGIPLIGDQWFNVEQYVKFNIGKRLLLEAVTEKQLMNDINTIINDESYRENVVKLRKVTQDHLQPPLERAVWWTEHVLRHGGGEHLRAPGAHLHWTEYYEIEIVLLILFAFVLFLGVTVSVIYFTVSNIIKYYVSDKVKIKVN